MFPHGKTVERLRRVLVKAEHGSAMVLAEWEDEDNPPEVLEIPGVAIGPAFSSRSESTNREQSFQGHSLYASEDVDVEVGDRIRCDGLLWEVAGEPKRYFNPFTGWSAGSETPLERVKG